MTDQGQPQEQNTPSPTPAEVNNTSSDNRIPLDRFNQVLSERNSIKSDYEKLQARLSELEAAETKRREAEMTELEKAQAKALEVEQQYQTLQQQLEAERQQRAVDRRNSAIANSLSAAGATDADGLLIILQARNTADLDAIVPDASGNYDPDAIKALVDKARQTRPQDFQPSGPGSPSNRGGETPHLKLSGKHAAVALTQEELDMARAMGIEPEEYAKYKK